MFLLHLHCVLNRQKCIFCPHCKSSCCVQPIKRCLMFKVLLCGLDFGPIGFQGGRGYSMMLKYKPWPNVPSLNVCWRRWLGPKVRFTCRKLLLLLAASSRLDGKLCYLSEKEMKEEKLEKAELILHWDGHSQSSLIFFSAPISPMKQRQMFKAWERCLSM